MRLTRMKRAKSRHEAAAERHVTAQCILRNAQHWR